MKANPFALILGAVFGVVGYFVGTKINTSQAQNRDIGPGEAAKAVPLSVPKPGETADPVTNGESSQ